MNVTLRLEFRVVAHHYGGDYGERPDVVQMPTSWAAAVTRMGALASLDSPLNVSGGIPRSSIP